MRPGTDGPGSIQKSLRMLPTLSIIAIFNRRVHQNAPASGIRPAFFSQIIGNFYKRLESHGLKVAHQRSICCEIASPSNLRQRREFIPASATKTACGWTGWPPAGIKLSGTGTADVASPRVFWMHLRSIRICSERGRVPPYTAAQWTRASPL